MRTRCIPVTHFIDNSKYNVIFEHFRVGKKSYFIAIGQNVEHEKYLQ